MDGSVPEAPMSGSIIAGGLGVEGLIGGEERGRCRSQGGIGVASVAKDHVEAVGERAWGILVLKVAVVSLER